MCDFISVLEDVFSISLIFCIGVCVFTDLNVQLMLMFLSIIKIHLYESETK